MGVGRVPACHAHQRRLQMVEAGLGDDRHQLRAIAAGPRGFVHDDAAAGLAYRGHDGRQVQRPDAAQVDDLGVDAGLLRRGFADEDHGAVGQHGDLVAGAEQGGRVQRHRVVAFGDFTHRVLGPGNDRLVMVPVEGAVVQALGLQEDHRVVVFDAGNQQALGVIGVAGHHRAQAADMREQRFGALAVRLPAVDAATAGHADGQRRGEVTGRAVAPVSYTHLDVYKRQVEATEGVYVSE